MQQHTFKSYKEYVERQRTFTVRKMKMGFGRRPFSPRETISAIEEYHSNIGVVQHGLCHGVRYGKELDMFEEIFGAGQWVGTEITPELCDGKRILCYDFSVLPDGWERKFDVIFTNSLDHAYKPEETVSVWLKELSSSGRLYVEWTPWSNRLGRYSNKADCFAASKDEHEKLFSKLGTIEGMVEVQLKRARAVQKYGEIVLFVVKK